MVEEVKINKNPTPPATPSIPTTTVHVVADENKPKNVNLANNTPSNNNDVKIKEIIKETPI